MDKGHVPQEEDKDQDVESQNKETYEGEKDVKDMGQELEQARKHKLKSNIKAWEDKKTTQAEYRAQRRMADADEWEKAKKASHEAECKQIETEVERLKQLKLEKLKNKEAQRHRTVSEKKASIEVQRLKSTLKIHEKAEQHRSTNTLPTKCCGLCKD